MPELLLEIQTEEIPARMQTRAAEDLLRLARDKFAAAGLDATKAQSFVTPRRLTLVVEDLPAIQASTEEERRGPRVGSPQAAIDGFLKSAGVTLAQCEQRDTGKGVFYFAVIRKTGGATAAILPELLRAVLLDLPWPKSMRFPAATFRWVRPIGGVLCLFDGKVVPLDLGGIATGNLSQGHRFLSPGLFAVTNFADYSQRLRDSHVILDAKDRTKVISLALNERATEQGLTLKNDPGLLDEVTGLVEWPVVMTGTIDPAFMDLPPEVLITSMRTHQKYFSCLDRDGTLAPHFLVVANISPTTAARRSSPATSACCARASPMRASSGTPTARSSSKAGCRNWRSACFTQKLGTLFDKAERMSQLATEIAHYMAPRCRNCSAASWRAQERQARRPTGQGRPRPAMVGEFPELQGVMGRYYAAARRRARRCRRRHRRALFAARPERPLSDRAGERRRCARRQDRHARRVFRHRREADRLEGSVRAAPRGARRHPAHSRERAALAAVQVLRGSLARGRTPRQQPVRRTSRSAELLDFFADRLQGASARRRRAPRSDRRGVRARRRGRSGAALARVEALAAFLGTEDGANLLTAYRRAANIVRIEEKQGWATYARHAGRDSINQEQRRSPWRNVLDERRELRSPQPWRPRILRAAMAALASLASLRSMHSFEGYR